MVKYGKRSWGSAFGNTLKKYGPPALRMGYRLASSAVRARTKRRGTRSGGMSTYQKDQTRLYQKKRMPSRMKKRWKRSIRKHRALNQIDLGLRTLIVQDNDNIVSAAGLQQHIEFGSLTNAGPIGAPDQNSLYDLSRIYNAESLDPTSKINLVSYRQDITLRNQGSHVVEIDIYDITPTRITSNVTTSETVSKAWNKGYADSELLGALVKPTIYTLGSNPFQSRYLSQHFRINKVKRVYLGVGNCTSWTISKPKNPVLSMSSVVDSANVSYLPKHSTCQLCVFRGCPSATAASEVASISWNVQTTMNYKLEGVTTNAVAVV